MSELFGDKKRLELIHGYDLDVHKDTLFDRRRRLSSALISLARRIHTGEVVDGEQDRAKAAEMHKLLLGSIGTTFMSREILSARAVLSTGDSQISLLASEPFSGYSAQYNIGEENGLLWAKEVKGTKGEPGGSEEDILGRPRFIQRVIMVAAEIHELSSLGVINPAKI